MGVQLDGGGGVWSSAEALVAEEATGMVVRNPLSQHALERLARRGITKAQVKVAIKRGAQYFDRRNGTIAHVLEGGYASGRSLLVSTDSATGRVTTAYSMDRFNPAVQFEGADRFIPIP